LQEQVSESTQALRSRRNALAPISRLPPEILAAMFSLLSFYTNWRQLGEVDATPKAGVVE
jgi:hypothetical protein